VLNPFVVGGALSDASGFFGREDLFAFVRDALRVKRRVPIVIYGQRRIGKSSVLRQLPRYLEADSVCVFYDLQGKASLDMNAVLYGLAREISHACGLTKPERMTITEETFLDGFLAQVMRTLGAPERLVLLFDEFDVVDPQAAATAGVMAASHRLLDYVADLVEREPRIGYVFVVGRKTSELSAAFSGTILRNSVSQKLGRFDSETSERLARLQSIDTLVFDRSAVEALYAVAAGHPYCSQLLCHTIWKRNVPDNSRLPARISAEHVLAAVPDAVEFGTNGLNWIYDGLDNPSHRLFLAALAELSGAEAAEPASLARIEQRLYERGTTVDAAELRGAPVELSKWDVVEAAGDGYRFSVPMIGRWIRANRPLIELQDELHLVNPRAWRFYELALDAKRKNDLDEAIGHFQQALAANPAMIDGWLALAACYKARGQSGDLDLAIDAFQRAYDLDQTGPRQGLLDALGEALTGSVHDAERLALLYGRMVAIEPDGPSAARARRSLAEAGRIRLPFGKRLAEAEALYRAIDDRDGVETARRRRMEFRPYEQASTVAMWCFLAGIGLAFVDYAWLFGWTRTVSVLGRTLTLSFIVRSLTLAAGIAGLMVGAELDHEPRADRLALGAAVTLLGVMVLAWVSGNLWVAGAVGLVGAGIVSAVLTPTPGLPQELRTPEPPKAPLGLPARVAQAIGTALMDYARNKREAARRALQKPPHDTTGS
jgi:tetratricopeptide (TPR) repeat protein